jgi:hypothetical protein
VDVCKLLDAMLDLFGRWVKAGGCHVGFYVVDGCKVLLNMLDLCYDILLDDIMVLCSVGCRLLDTMLDLCCGWVQVAGCQAGFMQWGVQAAGDNAGPMQWAGASY